ncbi:MAG TPA: hypothetical protein VLZ28_02810 [Daejeonella sp.]|nr:hypothetical protein [Daejeonella sp.]
MSLFKNLLIGAAVVAGVNYITKKRPDGRSMMDDIKEKAPEWMNKAKEFTQKDRFSDAADQFNRTSDQFSRNAPTTDNY